MQTNMLQKHFNPVPVSALQFVKYNAQCTLSKASLRSKTTRTERILGSEVN